MNLKSGQKLTIKDAETDDEFYVNIVYVSDIHKKIVIEDTTDVDILEVNNEHLGISLYCDRISARYEIVSVE